MYKQELTVEKDKKNKAETVLRLGNMLGTALSRLEDRLLQINVDYIKPDMNNIKVTDSDGDNNNHIVKTNVVRKRVDEILISVSKKNKKEDDFSYFTVVDGSKEEKIFYDKYALAKYILYSTDEFNYITDDIKDISPLGVYNYELFTVELDEVL